MSICILLFLLISGYCFQVASLLGLAFVPLRWERYDLMIGKDRFFDKPVQLFLGLVQEAAFREIAAAMEGYDLSVCAEWSTPGRKTNTRTREIPFEIFQPPVTIPASIQIDRVKI